MAVVARIIKAGPCSLLMDNGRQGCQHFGMSPGGAADRAAFAWCHRLLGNTPGSPAIEITAGPFTIEFFQELNVALTGAEHDARIGARTLTNWSSFTVKKGDVLTMGFARTGLRSYFSIAGQWQVKTLFASCQQINDDGSVRKLVDGDCLAVTDCRSLLNNRSVPWWLIPDFEAPLTLRLHPGYQFEQFASEDVHRLVTSEYRLSQKSNRMGCRLEGAAINWQHPGIVSEGIAYGAVQVPPDGQPIILLNDRQTIGGYPKLGCILAQDCGLLAQRRPGQALRFALTSTLPAAPAW